MLLLVLSTWCASSKKHSFLSFSVQHAHVFF